MWVYYGYPSSCYEGVNVEDARYRCGCALACRDEDVRDVDLVAGVPDSGVGHAIGYSNSRRLPYKRAFVKYTPTWPRSFMPQNQKMRDLVAKMKLLPNEAFIRGSRMVLLDDSIVRGTQLKDNIVKLTEVGRPGAAYPNRLSAADLSVRISQFLYFALDVRPVHAPRDQGIGGNRGVFRGAAASICRPGQPEARRDGGGHAPADRSRHASLPAFGRSGPGDRPAQGGVVHSLLGQFQLSVGSRKPFPLLANTGQGGAREKTSKLFSFFQFSPYLCSGV